MAVFPVNLYPAWWFLVVVAAAGLCFLLGICIYRLVFHPYSKYPGPWLAKVTSWYAVYHTYIGDLHTDIWACHEKYGNYVRYGPNRLLVNTEGGLKGIYGHGKNVRKSKGYLRISLIPNVHPTLGTLDNREHGKLRRILNQGLSTANIRGMDAELSRAAELFATRAGENQDRFDKNLVAGNDGWSAPKNMAEWSDFFTFDVMSQLVFGMSYHLLNDAANHWIIDGVLGQMRRISFLTTLPEIQDMGLQRYLFPGARDRALRFSAKSREIMESRKEREKSRDDDSKVSTRQGDMFSFLLSAKDPETGEGLSQKQLWAESNLLIIAGSDTSSTGIAAAFFYLSRSPEAYARVTEQVRTHFAPADTIQQGAQLNACTYLLACVQEALRLSPAAAGAMWREVLPGGLEIPSDGLHIPAGCEVGTGIFSLNHNEEYFPEPFAFRPERWIPEEAQPGELAKAKAAFATFSFGPRNCVGKGLAIIEIQLALAAVIHKYDFRQTGGSLRTVGVDQSEGKLAGAYRTRWAFTSLKDGPYIEFKEFEE